MDRNSISAAHIAAIVIIMIVSIIQVSAVFSEPINATYGRLILQTDVPPAVVQGRTMAPCCSIFEVLGGVVQRNEETRVPIEPPKVSAGNDLYSQLQREIITAYRFAYSLEEQLWDQAEAFETKEAVFQFMQQGFSDVFAWELADYYWTEPEGLLGLGAYLIVPEHTIYVLEIGKETKTASLWHETDEWERDHWEMDVYKIVTLQLEDGVWKVQDERSIGTPPAVI